MRVYVAGKWEEREHVRTLQELLRKIGHEITVDWTYHKYADVGYPKQYALDDIRGVKEADVFVGLFQNSYNYKGALVEMGVALGKGIPVCIIGHAIDSCLFTHHPNVEQFEGIQEFLTWIGERRKIMSPYITQECRKLFDKDIEKLVDNAHTVGDLNYIVTKLLYGYIQKYADREGVSYSAYNAIIGVLECVKLELYRKVISVYEDKKAVANGDVYE